MAIGFSLEELNKLLEKKKKQIAALPKPKSVRGKPVKPIASPAPSSKTPGGREVRHRPAAPPPSPQQIAARQLSQTFAPTPPLPAPAQQIFQSPDTALRTGQIQPTAPQLGPAARVGQFLTNIFSASAGFPSSTQAAPQQMSQQVPASPVSQLVSPFTGRQPSATGAPPTPDLTPGGREIRHRPAVPSAPAPAIPPGTEQQLSYLDTLRATDPDRALEVARFQSATIGRNTPESALATNVFFTEHAIFDLGQIPRNATEGVWNVIAQRAGYEGTGAELLEELGYIPIGGGMWFLPDKGEGKGGGGRAGGGGARYSRPLTSRAPMFSGRPGRYSGTRGAFIGLTNWRI